MIRPFLVLITLVLVATSCIEPLENSGTVPSGAEVYVPVYADDSIAHTISIETARSIVDPAKIFIYQDYLMVNIKGEGFHVIDNSNPSAPQPLFFISVPGSNDVAIKDGYIYTDNYGDIVAFTIDENQEIQILKRLEEVMNNQLYPPMRDVYFECVDEAKGIVIDWVISDGKTANCYRP
jgi:hypothetical protein